jgi:hypothetical protein
MGGGSYAPVPGLLAVVGLVAVAGFAVALRGEAGRA